MTDQCVRLGMALVVIALVSAALYVFGTRASAVEPSYSTNQLSAVTGTPR